MVFWINSLKESATSVFTRTCRGTVFITTRDWWQSKSCSMNYLSPLLFPAMGCLAMITQASMAKWNSVIILVITAVKTWSSVQLHGGRTLIRAVISQSSIFTEKKLLIRDWLPVFNTERFTRKTDLENILDLWPLKLAMIPFWISVARKGVVRSEPGPPLLLQIPLYANTDDPNKNNNNKNSFELDLLPKSQPA